MRTGLLLTICHYSFEEAITGRREKKKRGDNCGSHLNEHNITRNR